MIDQRFMDDLAKDFVLPTEKTDTLLAAGPVTSDVPQTGVRLGRAGVTPQQSAKAGGLDKPLIALLDTLAGAMRGATGAAIGLPGDIRSIVDLINQEGAEAVMGKRMFPTSEEVLQSNTLPQVVPAGAPNAAERQKTVDVAQAVGEFLPAPGLLDVPKVVKGATKAVQATKGMPVGMSTQMVGEGVSELGFYSAAKEAVNSIQQPKGTGEQFLKQIEKTPGVKPEEIKWTGLDDFLKSKKSVTKAEVQDYLDKNRVEVKEVQLGGGYKAMETELNKQGYDLNVDMDGDWSIFKDNEYVEFFDLPKDLQKFVMENSPGKTETKFSKYTLPGGENYREILITLPGQFEFLNKADNKLNAVGKQLDELEKQGVLETDQRWINANKDYLNASNERDAAYERARKMSDGGFYESKHFDQQNILAHLRVNDRVDADGKKVLFVEEVQSDWHQAGRKKGYNTLEQRAANQKKLDALDAERKTLEAEKVRLEELAKPFTNQGKDAPDDILDKWNMTANRLNNLQREYAPIANQLATGSGVPDAPFKTTWHELSMKRAIQLAAEGGYDRVAFTTGKTQAERYDLSKQVKMISAMPDKNGKYNIYIEGKDGDPVFRNTNGFSEYGHKTVTPEEFEELVGKDAAKTIMQKTDELNRGKVSKDQFKFYDSKPADLTVGGEGMKGFYDQILPKFLDKYAKKWDGKVGKTNIQADGDSVPVQYIDVTPKMKESVLTKGQPLFAIGAGGAAVQQEDNK